MTYNEQLSKSIQNSGFLKDYPLETQNKKVPEQFENFNDNYILTHKGENVKNKLGDGILEWQEPIPFDEFEMPEFPVETFPPEIANFLEALSISTQTPLEMSGGLVLGVLATCLQKKFIVRASSDHKEVLCLYTAAVASPGERKSAVINELIAPLINYENEYNENHKEEIEQNKTEFDCLTKRLDVLKKRYSENNEKYPVSYEEIEQAQVDIINFKKKIYLRIRVNDITPEKLANVMAEQGGKISIVSSEGGIFASFLGNHNHNINIDIYLLSHDGEPFSCDRISRGTDNLQSPALSMVLTVQPIVLEAFVKNFTFKGRGLVARFLFVVCKSKIGERLVSPPTIPENIRSGYTEKLNNLLKIDMPETAELRLSEEARETQLEYAKIIEMRLDDEYYNIKDFGGKIVGTMLRIAGILHCLKHESPEKKLISPETVKDAIKIQEFLNQHALVANRMMKNNKDSENAKYILKRIKMFVEPGGNITKRQLHRKCRSFQKIDEMEKPLEILQKKHFIKIHKNQSATGRSSEIINLNPLEKRDKCDRTYVENEEKVLLSLLSHKNRDFENENFNPREFII